ncbi:MAG: glutamine-hydrolyzing carbamoyl-phosphate synthase small subunit [Pseudomonadota bacterium]
MNQKTAFIVLENGIVLEGVSVGYSGVAFGELVFNTAMYGYQEILSDPSYYNQMVVFTYPHIGNTGANSEDDESVTPFARGVVINNAPCTTAHWRQEQSFIDYLIAHQIVGIAEVDTRHLTHTLREQGAMNACIVSDGSLSPEEALLQVKTRPKMTGLDLAKVVSCKKPYVCHEAPWAEQHRIAKSHPYHVVVYDFGVKRSILTALVGVGCRVTVVPAQTTAQEALALKPDGIFMSNGPGDPEPCTYAIEAIKHFLKIRIPLFGVCLGFQLLGLACGAQTKKMKFGHHGGNHPVIDARTKRVWITSQNHGFCVDEATLPDCLEITHRSAFDGTLQGISHRDAPAFAFQGHPEAGPGPHDARGLFSEFVTLLENAAV